MWGRSCTARAMAAMEAAANSRKTTRTRPTFRTTPQFADRKQYAVSARFAAHGEVESTGIDFSDYQRCGTIQHKRSGERRFPTPRWAVNDELLRLLLVCFLEERMIHANSERLWTYWKKVAEEPLDVRLKFAQETLLKERPRHSATLDGLCKEFVGTANSVRKRQLQIQIQNVDTFLRYTEKDAGLATIAAVVSLYYRYSTDSVGVGFELTLKPPHVRQILSRLFETARKLAALDPRFVDGASVWYQRQWNQHRLSHPPSGHTTVLTYRNETATLVETAGRLLKIRNARGEELWVDRKAVVVDFAQVEAAA